MTETTQYPPEGEGIRRYGDVEAEAASGMALPSLRVMQAAGAIRAWKEPKAHGGFRRTWAENDILKAAIAATLGDHLAWNIRLVAKAMAAHQAIWDKAVAMSLAASEHGDIMVPERRMMLAERLDWFAELTDRRFLFLAQPPELMAVTGIGTDRILMGMVGKDSFHAMSSAALSPEGRAMAVDLRGEEAAARIERNARLAMKIGAQCLGKATINISMAVRAAWRRLHGLDVRYATQPLDGVLPE